MKKILLIFAILSFFTCFDAYSQTRTKIKEGLYLVTYGNTTVIEDDINKRTISLAITKEIHDRKEQNKKEVVYKIVCGKWTKRVVKDGLKLAISAGIKASGASGGTSLMISSAATLATHIYDDFCKAKGL